MGDKFEVTAKMWILVSRVYFSVDRNLSTTLILQVLQFLESQHLNSVAMAAFTQVRPLMCDTRLSETVGLPLVFLLPIISSSLHFPDAARDSDIQT